MDTRLKKKNLESAKKGRVARILRCQAGSGGEFSEFLSWGGGGLQTRKSVAVGSETTDAFWEEGWRVMLSHV